MYEESTGRITNHRNSQMSHYEKAPITEALIDIRVELSTELRFEDLHAIRKHVSKDYPQEETRNLAEGTIQFAPAMQASVQQKPWGLLFRNEAKNQVLQARLDGFTFSRLEPYETFEKLRGEARRLWDIYRELMRPKRVTRVAVRYINQLPELRNFGPYLMRLPMHQGDLKGTLVINEAMTPAKSPDTVSIVLDFDLHVDDPPVTTEQELWSFFDRLRERKNAYFEACITDKTRELIR